MKNIFINPSHLKTTLFAFTLGTLSPLAWSAEAYQIDYQIERLDTNGVTTIQKYSEKMIRDVQNIWIERLNTQAHDQHQAHESNEAVGDEHTSFYSAIQWIKHVDEAMAENQFQRFYILPDEKMRVELHDVDQEMLGMKNCWRCEYSLIHPDILKRAQLIQRDPKLAHYQIRSAGQTLNIIWNEQDQLVQKYELLKPMSGYAKTFTVRKIDQHVATPWIQTEKYSERDYADFSD